MALREAGTERLGAFSDGVIAVIITIMVLELRPPQGSSPVVLLALWPSFLSYVLSYIFVGIVWVNHHRLLRQVDNAEPTVIGTNLVFLFSVSLIPFFTAYTAQNHLSSFSIAVYSGLFFFITIAYMLFECAVIRVRRHSDVRGEKKAFAAWRNWVGLACYAVAVPCAYLSPAISLSLIFVVAVIYSSPHWRRVEAP